MSMGTSWAIGSWAEGSWAEGSWAGLILVMQTVTAALRARTVYSQVSSKRTGDETVYRVAASNKAYSQARSKKVVDSERTVSA